MLPAGTINAVAADWTSGIRWTSNVNPFGKLNSRTSGLIMGNIEKASRAGVTSQSSFQMLRCSPVERRTSARSASKGKGYGFVESLARASGWGHSPRKHATRDIKRPHGRPARD
jgi:hypothetical protein